MRVGVRWLQWRCLAEKPRRVYLKFKAVFDRAAGAVMTVLGLKLIFGMK